MKPKALIYGMEKKSLNDLTKTEQIRLYLNDHPECLTERLMAWVASYIMNYGYIRMKNKELYPQIIHENIMKDNFVRIPDHYNEQE
jgi:hypothetical protein